MTTSEWEIPPFNMVFAIRMYWVYGPEQKDITIIGLEPHPEDQKRGAYDKITLSSLEPLA